jgi:HK97 family phage prohead protease
LGGFREVIKPGAFTRTLAASASVVALYNHDSNQVLGRVGSGTLRLEQDDIGLRFELDLPDTSYARDLRSLVERRDVAGCSFAFSVRPGGELWEERNGETIRTLTALDLGEITICASPAYGDTSVALRNRPITQGFVDLNRLWLETV